MKEISGTSRNYLIVKSEDNKFTPTVELIFIVTEPEYHFTVGEMVKERKAESIRMSTTHAGIKNLIDILNECDKDFGLLEKQAAAAGMFPEAKKA